MWVSIFQRLRVLLPWVHLTEVTLGCGGVQCCHPDPLQGNSAPARASSRWGAQSWASWPEPNPFLIASRKKWSGPPFSENHIKILLNRWGWWAPTNVGSGFGLRHRPVQSINFRSNKIELSEPPLAPPSRCWRKLCWHRECHHSDAWIAKGIYLLLAPTSTVFLEADGRSLIFFDVQPVRPGGLWPFWQKIPELSHVSVSRQKPLSVLLWQIIALPASFKSYCYKKAFRSSSELVTAVAVAGSFCCGWWPFQTGLSLFLGSFCRK